MILDLTNYEMLDLAHSHISNGTDDLNRLAAAFTAYLIVSYRAGRELSAFQCTVVTFFFVSVVAQAAVGAYGEVSAAIGFWRAAHGDHIGSMAEMFNRAGIFLWLGGVLASLAFMWRVRHPKSE